MGTGVVIGRESALAAGYADLVLVDESGQLCIVEVKNAGNPDTRRVVAQLLDYASSLWGSNCRWLDMSRVLGPYLEHEGSTQPHDDVGEFVARAVAGEDATPELAAAITGGLSKSARCRRIRPRRRRAANPGGRPTGHRVSERSRPAPVWTRGQLLQGSSRMLRAAFGCPSARLRSRGSRRPHAWHRPRDIPRERR